MTTVSETDHTTTRDALLTQIAEAQLSIAARQLTISESLSRLEKRMNNRDALAASFGSLPGGRMESETSDATLWPTVSAWLTARVRRADHSSFVTTAELYRAYLADVTTVGSAARTLIERMAFDAEASNYFERTIGYAVAGTQSIAKADGGVVEAPGWWGIRLDTAPVYGFSLGTVAGDNGLSVEAWMNAHIEIGEPRDFIPATELHRAYCGHGRARRIAPALFQSDARGWIRAKRPRSDVTPMQEQRRVRGAMVTGFPGLRWRKPDDAAPAAPAPALGAVQARNIWTGAAASAAAIEAREAEASIDLSAAMAEAVAADLERDDARDARIAKLRAGLEPASADTDLVRSEGDLIRSEILAVLSDSAIGDLSAVGSVEAIEIALELVRETIRKDQRRDDGPDQIAQAYTGGLLMALFRIQFCLETLAGLFAEHRATAQAEGGAA